MCKCSPEQKQPQPQRTLLKYEVVTPDGTVRYAHEDEDKARTVSARWAGSVLRANPTAPRHRYW